MIRTSLLTTIGLTLSTMAVAQNQSWTATDINGQTHDIQAYLDEGKTVLVDISAYWCGPCWAWHKSGIMHKLYEEFGPEGTNDLVILWVDGDPATSVNLLNGIGSGTQGDWVEGTNYPIIGPNGQGSTLANIYNIDAYPTLFVHCPGGSAGVEIDREATWETFLESWMDHCPDAFTHGPNDATLLAPEVRKVCTGANPKIQLRNQGSSNLTSATIQVMQNGETVATMDWTGDLAPNTHQEVVLENLTVSGTQEFEIQVSMPNGQTDDNTDGDIQHASFEEAPAAPLEVTLKLRTDSYGEETTWQLLNGAGSVVQQDPAGNYGNNTLYTYNWMLDADDCYTFRINDAYGDGICCSYGQGYYRLQYTSNNTIFSQGGQFGGREESPFLTSGSVSVEEVGPVDGVSVYPNPTNGILNLNIQLPGVDRVAVDVFNVLGERVKTATLNTGAGAQVRSIDLSDLNNGVYYVSLIGKDNVKVTRKVTLSK